MVDSGSKENSEDPLNNEPESLAADLDKMSDESLDQFLEEVDPEFSSSLKSISADKSLSLADIEVTAADQELTEERAGWESKKGVLKFIFKLSPYGIPRASLKFKKAIFKFKAGLRAVFVSSKNFLFDIAVTSKKALTQGVKNSRENIKQRRLAFRDKSLRWTKGQKAMFYLTVLLALATVAFVYIAITKGIFPPEEKDFISSWSEQAVPVMEYSDSEVEPFYDNLRSGQNLILIQKMVVNIKRSANSGRNPMVAVELFLEGNNPDVIIEVKHRESELRDMMQRSLEEFNFDQLDSAGGKKELTDGIKRELNRVLTTGALRRVLIKTLILKN